MKTLTTLLLLLFTAPTLANNTELEIKAFMDQYIGSYNVYLGVGENAEIGGITRHFYEPTLQIPPQGAPFLSEDYSILNKGFERFLSFVKTKGANTFEWHKLQIVPLGENKAIVSGVALIRNAQGEEVDRRSSIYSLYNSEAGWRIVVLHSHPLRDVPLLEANQ